jgi:hypothetical protein
MIQPTLLASAVQQEKVHQQVLLLTHTLDLMPTVLHALLLHQLFHAIHATQDTTSISTVHAEQELQMILIANTSLTKSTAFNARAVHTQPPQTPAFNVHQAAPSAIQQAKSALFAQAATNYQQPPLVHAFQMGLTSSSFQHLLSSA